MVPIFHFRVFLRWPQGSDSTPVQSVEVDAETRHLAARLAEIENPGWVVYAVAVRWELVGRCERCKAVLFADDEPRPGRSGPRCLDC